ncbi:MAG: ArsA family ATPase [Actinomycetota bacterium]
MCAGSGGVGKTTISAAIALEAARRGRKTIVVTIDPAKRLANALGLKELSNEPRRIPKRKFTDAGLEQAPLYAMMLDTKRTFDALVIRYAKGPEQAERILGNHLYQAFSGAMSGTHEYMAMEKLYELDFEDTYDLIVIDTPPTRNAIDFLEAPKHLTSFFEGRLLKWFLIPAIGGGKGLFRAVNFAAVSFLKAVTRVVGAEVLKDTAEFAANFEGMYDGFKERAQAVYELLRQPATAFVVVTTPHDQAVEEALFFATTLNRHRLPFGGLVVNLIHPEFDVGLPDGAPTGSPVVDRLVQLAGEFEQGRKREDRSLRRLEWEVPQERWARIPYLSGEVTDLGSLVRVADCMFA